MISYVMTAVAAGLPCYLAGVLTFKRTLRWCPLCASLTRCLVCPGHPTPEEARKRVRRERLRVS